MGEGFEHVVVIEVGASDKRRKERANLRKITSFSGGIADGLCPLLDVRMKPKPSETCVIWPKVSVMMDELARSVQAQDMCFC